jgi:hypothetical protein
MSYTHYRLDDYFRNASFGREYKELTAVYSSWSTDLHKKGNSIYAYNLKIIANEGIIRWYCKNLANNFDVDYPLFYRINSIMKNPLDLSYYDWVNICHLCRIFNIRRNIFGDYNFNSGWKYEFVKTKFPKETELHPMIFAKILINKYSESELNSFISYFYDEIKVLEPYFHYGTIFRTFLKNNPDISDCGVSFQRLKVLVEKMQVVNCNNNSATKEIDAANFNPDIYKYDKFCDEIQECIYSWIKNYITDFLEKKQPKTIRPSELPLDFEKVKNYIDPVPDDKIYKIRL